MLFQLNDSIPTGTTTSDQAQHNAAVASLIPAILIAGLNQSEIQDLINTSKDFNITAIDNTDSPYDINRLTDEIIYCDTSSGAITINLPISTTPSNEGKRFIVICKSASNNVTVARNGNTIKGSASNTTISGAYAVKTYIYLGSTDYMEM